MPQFGGKDSKRHFTVVIGNKEHGLYVSSTPSSAAKKAVTKLCTSNKSKKVEFSIREITQGSKKKTYGPYDGYIEKLKEPIELKGRVIRYKPVAKLSGKSSAKKGGMNRNSAAGVVPINNDFPKYEQIAMIQFEELKGGEVSSFQENELIEKSEELKQLDGDIFHISTSNSSRNNVKGIRVKTSIDIYLNNYSRNKNKNDFNEKLNELIELLKYFKKAHDTRILNTEFTLFEQHDSRTPEYNEFLRILATRI
jgi:hypothetical protein